MKYAVNYESPVGTLAVVCDETSVVGLWLNAEQYFRSVEPGEIHFPAHTPLLERTCQWLDRYFTGDKPTPDELPLAPVGGEFRQMVWEILCEIPYGEMITYGDIAGQIASVRGLERMSVQAVGGAVGHNPISIIIPCHRVIGANGNLTGYGGGIATKQKLLAHEGIDISRLYVPKR